MIALAMRHLGRLAMLMVVALAPAACRREPAGAIDGEWALELTVVESPNTPAMRPGQRLRGLLVIDPRIPDAYETRAGREYSRGFTMGRIYFAPLPLSPDSAATARPYRFLPGRDGDIMEEALARRDSAGGFEAHLRPGVSHNGIRLRGTISAGHVTGRWTSDAYVGDEGPRGTFQMRRTGRTAATDSALLRSRRGREEWERNSR